LKNFFSPRLLRARWMWAAAAGIMFALAQPNFEVAGFAWVAPAVLLLSTFGATPKKAFKTGYIAGAVQQLITLHWLLFIPFPAGAVVGWIALSAFLALFTAAWCALAWKFFPFPAVGPLFDPTPTDRFTETNLLQRLIWSLLCAAAWVTLEMIQARIFGGFPWNYLGTSQFRMLPLIQIASITSVYGVSFVMVWFACAIFSAGMVLTREQNRRWAAELFLPLITIAVLIACGLSEIRSLPKSTRTVKVALVQPSIPQTVIFDPAEDETRFKELIRLSEMALKMKPQILMWPEAALPTALRIDTNTANAVLNLVTNNNVWAIVGSDDAVPRNPINPEADVIDYYNSAFAVSPRGELAGGYRKRLLVVFGEFVPLANKLTFLKSLLPNAELPFSRGDGPSPFHLYDLELTTSVLICFEDTFPHFARAYVREDTDFLVNLTNNGWFGESSAQWQHAATALFRAIENRVPLVRCTNNGLTCWIDSAGRIHEVIDRKNIYGPGFKIAEIPLLAKGQKRAPTFYNQYGDVFGWTCVGVSALAVALRARKRATRSSRTHP
jgi:apolipoprotein N-acyltransferase